MRDIRLCFLLFFVISILCLGSRADEVTSTPKPAPDRGGGTPYKCPPNFDPATGKSQDLNTDSNGKHKDYGDDIARQLYFEGSTRIVLKGDDGKEKENIEVIEWCKKEKPEDKGAGHDPRYIPEDFFTYQIVTSKNGTNTTQVQPDSPC